MDIQNKGKKKPSQTHLTESYLLSEDGMATAFGMVNEPIKLTEDMIQKPDNE